MRRYARLSAAASLALLTLAPARAADLPLRVFLDVSYAPDAGDFALKTSPLLLE